MPRLRRLLRLLFVSILVSAGTCAAVSGATAGEPPRDEPPPLVGFDFKTLAEVCDHYRGRFLEDRPRPYSYGCVLIDGEIDCTESAECTFFRLSDGLPPFQETCERAGDHYSQLEKFDIFRCASKAPPVVLIVCEPDWEVCNIGHEPPMP